MAVYHNIVIRCSLASQITEFIAGIFRFLLRRHARSLRRSYFLVFAIVIVFCWLFGLENQRYKENNQFIHLSKISSSLF
mgnify:CR=1 FL=1